MIVLPEKVHYTKKERYWVWNNPLHVGRRSAGLLLPSANDGRGWALLPRNPLADGAWHVVGHSANAME